MENESPIIMGSRKIESLFYGLHRDQLMEFLHMYWDLRKNNGACAIWGGLRWCADLGTTKHRPTRGTTYCYSS